MHVPALPTTQSRLAPEDFGEQGVQVDSRCDRRAVGTMGTCDGILVTEVGTDSCRNCLVAGREVEFTVYLAIRPEVGGSRFERPNSTHRAIHLGIFLGVR